MGGTRALRIGNVLAVAVAAFGCDSFGEGTTPGAAVSPDASDVTDAGSPGEAGADGGSDATIGTSDTATYRKAVMDDAPFAYWRMGDGAGASTADDSAGDHDAVVTVPGPTFGKEGIFGGASGSLTFDGVDAHHAAVEGLPLVDTAGLTFEFWIFLADPLDATYRHVAYSATSNVAYGVYLQQTAGIGVTRIEGGLKRYVQSGTSPTANAWHHVVATRSGVTLSLYVDNVAVGTQQNDGEIISASPLFLGAKTATGPSLANGTRLAEVAIYGKPLTRERIAAHYELGKR